MIKGCQRKVIVVKGEEESIFECAYFVLKNHPEHLNCKEEDMIAEANRIIEKNEGTKDVKSSDNVKTDKEGKGKKIIIPFSVGAAVGSAVGLIFLFF